MQPGLRKDGKGAFGDVTDITRSKPYPCVLKHPPRLIETQRIVARRSGPCQSCHSSVKRRVVLGSHSVRPNTDRTHQGCCTEFLNCPLCFVLCKASKGWLSPPVVAGSGDAAYSVSGPPPSWGAGPLC